MMRSRKRRTKWVWNLEDVDKDAFREATKGMIEDYCERYPGVAELLDIIESVK